MYQTLIEPAALDALMTNTACVVVDCRFELSEPKAGRLAYEQGHIPGAHYIDLEHDLSAPRSPGSGRHPLPQETVLCATLGRYGITKDTQVIAYDGANGVYASRVWWLMRWLGHKAVAVLDGGFKAWCESGYPVSLRVDPVASALYQGRGGQMRTVGTAEVVAVTLGQRPGVLVDARGAARFRGETEPFDPVAGHIPTALNRPFTQNLMSNERFESPAALRAAFMKLLNGNDPAQAIHYCGSGVSACHNVLAMVVAGLEPAVLYPGSWGAWVSDSARPVARG